MDEKIKATCFTCGEVCSEEYFRRLNTVKTEKYQTNITEIIKQVINDKNLELLVKDEDNICIPCFTLLQEFEKLSREAKIIGNILTKQIFRTYEIESAEKCDETIEIDKSQTFVEEVTETNEGEEDAPIYKCIYCNFETSLVENCSSHVLYHQILKKTKEAPKKEIQPADPATKKIASNVVLKPIKIEPKFKQIKQTPLNFSQLSVELSDSEDEKPPKKDKNDPDYEPEEESEDEEIIEESVEKVKKFRRPELESLINLDVLEDPDCESNLKVQKCVSCNFKPTSAAEYIKHLRIQHKTAPNSIQQTIRQCIKRPKKLTDLTCVFCFTSFSRQDQFENHVTKLHESISKIAPDTRLNRFITGMMQAVRCKFCDYEMTSFMSEPCEHHEAMQIYPEQKCKFCPMKFYNPRLYNTHLASVHFACFVCKVRRSNKMQIKTHLEEQHLCTLEYKCQNCNLEFTSKNNYEQHVHKHPSLSCLECKKIMSNASELFKHTRYRHADRKTTMINPTICDYCGLSFRSMKLYEQHNRDVHMKGAQKSYQCKICRGKFLYKYLLINHLHNTHHRDVTHLKEKFYKCFLCESIFDITCRKELSVHISSHRPDLLNCNDCEQVFMTKSQAEQHRERFHLDFSVVVSKLLVPVYKSPKKFVTPPVEIKKIAHAPIKLINPNPQITPPFRRQLKPQPQSHSLLKPTTKFVPKAEARVPQFQKEENKIIIEKNEIITNADFLNIQDQSASAEAEVAANQIILENLQGEGDNVNTDNDENQFVLMKEEEPTQEVTENQEIVETQGNVENQEVTENQEIVGTTEATENQELDQGTIFLQNNNFYVDEEGNIIVQDINLLTDENGQQIEINLQDLLQQNNFTTDVGDNIILQQEDEHGNLINIQDAAIEIQGENMQNFILQSEEIPQELMQNSNIQEQVLASSEDPQITIDGLQLINGDFNICNIQNISNVEGENSGIVVEEVVVDDTDQSNKQTLDELSDILKEVAAQAEKPLNKNNKRSFPGTSPVPRKILKTLPDRSPSKKIDTADNNLTKFSQAYEVFVQGFGDKSKKPTIKRTET